MKVWVDPWIPTTPASPARRLALVLHPNMRVTNLIDQKSKEWNVKLIEDYISPTDILLIRILAISFAQRRDTFYWITLGMVNTQ